VAAHTAEKEQHCEGKEVGGRDVEQRLSRAQHLEVVQERKHLLDRAEGAGLLELREDLGVLGLGKEAGVGKRGEDAQLLDALQEPHRRLRHADLTALEQTVLVEANDLFVQLHSGLGEPHG
jgi:hypothetical protein